jgi:ATP-dependent HslUV protease subunit HslV
VIYRRSGTIDVFEPRGKFAMNAPFYAFGSGKEPALGAMFAGADAETAIEAAIQFDPHTGGEITVLRHEG